MTHSQKNKFQGMSIIQSHLTLSELYDDLGYNLSIGIKTCIVNDEA